jgi:hypothetical protein
MRSEASEFKALREVGLSQSRISQAVATYNVTTFPVPKALARFRTFW